MQAQDQLWAAAFDGDVPALTKSIEAGADIHATDSDRRSLLHVACCEGHLQVVQYLIGKGAKLDAQQDLYGHDPLSYAIFNGHKDLVHYLRREGAELSQKSIQDFTLKLCRSAAEGDLSTLKTLVECGISINSVDYGKRSPLHLAVANSHVESVDFILKRGGDVDLRDNLGMTPMHVAVCEGRLEAERILSNYMDRDSGSLSTKYCCELAEFPETYERAGDKRCTCVLDEAMNPRTASIKRNRVECFARSASPPSFAKSFICSEFSHDFETFASSSSTEDCETQVDLTYPCSTTARKIQRRPTTDGSAMECCFQSCFKGGCHETLVPPKGRSTIDLHLSTGVFEESDMPLSLGSCTLNILEPPSASKPSEKASRLVSILDEIDLTDDELAGNLMFNSQFGCSASLTISPFMRGSACIPTRASSAGTAVTPFNSSEPIPVSKAVQISLQNRACSSTVGLDLMLQAARNMQDIKQQTFINSLPSQAIKVSSTNAAPLKFSLVPRSSAFSASAPEVLSSVRAVDFSRAASSPRLKVTSLRRATVVFVDIRGFTEACAAMSAQAAGEWVADFCSRVDAAARATGLYRLESRGDCCVCVAADAADAIALAAASTSRVGEGGGSQGGEALRALSFAKTLQAMLRMKARQPTNGADKDSKEAPAKGCGGTESTKGCSGGGWRSSLGKGTAISARMGIATGPLEIMRGASGPGNPWSTAEGGSGGVGRGGLGMGFLSVRGTTADLAARMEALSEPGLAVVHTSTALLWAAQAHQPPPRTACCLSRAGGGVQRAAVYDCARGAFVESAEEALPAGATLRVHKSLCDGAKKKP